MYVCLPVSLSVLSVILPHAPMSQSVCQLVRMPDCIYICMVDGWVDWLSACMCVYRSQFRPLSPSQYMPLPHVYVYVDVYVVVWFSRCPSPSDLFHCPCICLGLCHSVCLSVPAPVCRSACMPPVCNFPVCLYVCMCLSACLPDCMPVCMPARTYVCISRYNRQTPCLPVSG